MTDEHNKQDVEDDVTAAFAAQCKIVRKITELASDMEGQAIIEKMSPQMLSSITKFLKDHEMRIKLSDNADVQALDSKLDSLSERAASKQAPIPFKTA